MLQNTKQIQVLSNAEVKKLVNRGEARYIGKAAFSPADKLGQSDLETTLQTFATQHRADILVEVKDKTRCQRACDCTVYELYKLNKSQSRVY